MATYGERRKKLMTTNYYVKTDPCEKCGQCKTERHIGMSSKEWEFHFRAYHEESLISYKDWISQLNDPDSVIVDEKGTQIPFQEFKSFIDRKRIKKDCPSHCDDDYFKGFWKDSKGNIFINNYVDV